MEQRGIEIRVRNVNNINFGKTTLGSSKKVTLIGIWPYHSTPNDGLVVSADLAAFPQCFSVSPVSAAHIAAPVAPPVGF
ncbi:MAG: hypothetical protein U0X20_12805 [Caldilineaceae bacterium]